MSELELPIEHDGVLRLLAIPIAKLTELALAERPPASPPGGKLPLKLQGKATGLPDGTACRITTRTVKGKKSWTGVAPLGVQGWQPGQTLDCTLSIDVPLAAAHLFGEDELSVTVEPIFPGAPGASLAPFRFEHPFDVVVTGLSAEPVPVGHTLHFQPTFGPMWSGCAVQVAIAESDEGEVFTNARGKKVRYTKGGLTVALEWSGASPPAAKHWKAGCNAADLPDYAESDEEDPTYEFVYTVTVTLAGEKGVFAAGKPLCKTPRPTLTAFDLVLNERPLGRSVELFLRALTRSAHDGPRLGYSVVHATGTIGGLADDLAIEVGATLYSHHPAPWADGKDMRVVAFLAHRTATLHKGRFNVTLLDGAEISDLELGSLVEADGSLNLFAVLELPAHSERERLPMSDVLVYEPTKFRPFDLLGQPDPAAPFVCTRNVARTHLALVPTLGPTLDIHAEGNELVVRVPINGGSAAFWKAAAPVVEHSLDAGKTWRSAPTAPSATGRAYEARLAIAEKGWSGHGVAGVQFQARVTNTAARLDDAQPTTPRTVGPRTFDCVPAVTGVDAFPTKARDGVTPELTIRAETRYFPAGGKTDKSLRVELRDAAGTVVPAALVFSRPSDKEAGKYVSGLCEADGSFVVRVQDRATIGKLVGGSARVYRKGKLAGLDVGEAKTTRPIPPA